MYDPAARIADMDLEGIDVAVLYPPGSGEEWALGDVEFAAALCRTLNDARAEFASHAPDRFRLVAKLPMSAYFLGRCFVTTEPEEKMVPYVFRSLSPGAICYASDYCHWDSAFPDSVRILEERSDLDEPTKRALFSENAAKLYGLSPREER
jgi:predicted TIM-barrel fold metal-dependent hydrolase